MQQGGAGGGGVTRQDGVQNMTNYAWAEATHFSTPVKQMEGKTSPAYSQVCGSFTYEHQL